MKKNVKMLLAAGMLVMTLVACQSNEEKTISRLQAMSEQIEKKGDTMSDEDWDKLVADFNKLNDEAGQYNFTDEQKQEVAKLEGKIVKGCAKHSIQGVGKTLKGFFEGLTE